MNTPTRIALRRLCSVWTLTAILCCTTPLGAAYELFSEPFEDTNFSARGWYDGPRGGLSSSEHVPGSSKSFECIIQAGTKSCSGGSPRRVKFAPTESIYLSYWIKHSTNWSGGLHQFFFLTTDNGDYDGPAYTRLTAYVEQGSAGRLVMYIQDGQNVDKARVGQNLVNITENRALAGCNGDSDGYGNGGCFDCGGGDWCNAKDKYSLSTTFFADAPGALCLGIPCYKSDWHQIEAYYKMNSVVAGKGQRDGLIRLWYDGQLILDRDQVMLRTGRNPNQKFNQMILSPDFATNNAPSSTMTFWIDNLRLGTDRPMIALDAPNNLRIIP